MTVRLQLSVMTGAEAASVPPQWSAHAYVLLVPWELEHPGGVNQVVLNLYDELDSLAPGLPRILVKSWAHRRAVDGSVSGRRTRRWRFRDPFAERNRLKAVVLFWGQLPLVVARLYRWLMRERVRVVNAHYPGLWLLPFAILRSVFGCPLVFVISIHGLDLQEAKAALGLRRWLWRRVLGAADRLIACSEALAAEARNAFPELAGRVEAIPNGVNAEALRASARAPAAAAERLSEGRRYLASVATFEAKKGQDVLLAAFARLADEWVDLDLVLVGRHGATLAANRRQAAEYNLTERVLFLPDLAHDQALGVIRGASVFVLPSRYEPFGIVVLEAGAQGVPVVASRVGGVPEIVADGEHGRLVPPEDPGALAGGIRHMLEEPEAAEAMANALQRRVLEAFSWQRAAERYLQVAGVVAGCPRTGARGEALP